MWNILLKFLRLRFKSLNFFFSTLMGGNGRQCGVYVCGVFWTRGFYILFSLFNVLYFLFFIIIFILLYNIRFMIFMLCSLKLVLDISIGVFVYNILILNINLHAIIMQSGVACYYKLMIIKKHKNETINYQVYGGWWYANIILEQNNLNQQEHLILKIVKAFYTLMYYFYIRDLQYTFPDFPFWMNCFTVYCL